MCQSKECSEAIGFVCEDPFVNNDSDLSIQFKNHIKTWMTMIYDALNYEKVLPAAAKEILATCNGCRYTFLCQGCVMFHSDF